MGDVPHRRPELRGVPVDPDRYAVDLAGPLAGLFVELEWRGHHCRRLGVRSGRSGAWRRALLHREGPGVALLERLQLGHVRQMPRRRLDEPGAHRGRQRVVHGVELHVAGKPVAVEHGQLEPGALCALGDRRAAAVALPRGVAELIAPRLRTRRCGVRLLERRQLRRRGGRRQLQLRQLYDRDRLRGNEDPGRVSAVGALLVAVERLALDREPDPERAENRVVRELPDEGEPYLSDVDALEVLHHERHVGFTGRPGLRPGLRLRRGLRLRLRDFGVLRQHVEHLLALRAGQRGQAHLAEQRLLHGVQLVVVPRRRGHDVVGRRALVRLGLRLRLRLRLRLGVWSRGAADALLRLRACAGVGAGGGVELRLLRSGVSPALATCGWRLLFGRRLLLCLRPGGAPDGVDGLGPATPRAARRRRMDVHRVL